MADTFGFRFNGGFQHIRVNAFGKHYNLTGMMCGHCEAHVNKAIQEAFGVQDVVSSHDAGTTIFSAPEKVDEDKIRQVIKDAGYEVTGITQE